MQDKLHKFESLIFRIRKLENEKIRIKENYIKRLNVRIHILNTEKGELKKQIIGDEKCKQTPV